MDGKVAGRPGLVRRERWHEVRGAVQDCVILAVACLVSYLVASDLLSRVYFLSRADDLLGGVGAFNAASFPT